MYLSRVKLDIKSKYTQIALASPNKIHGAIEEAFPWITDRSENSRKLWRIDRFKGNVYLLLLSREIPDFSNFVGQFCESQEDVETKEYDVLFGRIKGGTTWRFRIVANPTKSIKCKNGRGKVVAHVTPEYQMEWLTRQADKHGFEIVQESSSVISSEWKSFKKKDKREIRLLQVTYEGVLIVKDVDLFVEALKNGIGREKAYGMGLLTIMRV